MNKLLEIYAKKPVVSVGQVNGAMGDNIEEDFSSTDDDEDQADYEQEYVEEEMQRYAQCMRQAETVSYHIYINI